MIKIANAQCTIHIPLCMNRRAPCPNKCPYPDTAVSRKRLPYVIFDSIDR